jgi:hypothetical protein
MWKGAYFALLEKQIRFDSDFGENFAKEAIPQILAIASIFVLIAVLQAKRKRQFGEMWEMIIVFCVISAIFLNLTAFTSFGEVVLGWFQG